MRPNYEPFDYQFRPSMYGNARQPQRQASWNPYEDTDFAEQRLQELQQKKKQRKKEEKKRAEELRIQEMKRKEEEKKIEEEKRKEEEKQKWLSHVNDPQVQNDSASTIQKMWRGTQIRKADPLSRLRELKKIEDDVKMVISRKEILQKLENRELIEESLQSAKNIKKSIVGFG